MTEQVPNPNKALWEKGDFTRIAETMRASGEALVAKLDISGELRVLDLGCGVGASKGQIISLDGLTWRAASSE
ncbi:MAG: hypothetical protein QM729_18540 [Solirubrobacterales bacterium]